jgi:hypothetical protein
MFDASRQMVIDPADYEDTMQLPGEPQKNLEDALGDGCPDRPHRILRFEGKYLIMWSTTMGDSNE